MARLPGICGSFLIAHKRSRRLVRDLAERAEPGQLAAGLGDIGALAAQIVRYGVTKIGVDDVVRGVGRMRQISARELVLTLRAGLDDLEAALDREFDRLIVADLEMQERMMLDRAPVAAEQRVRADEVDRARDPATVAFRHHQQHVIAHAFADQREECARQIRPSPFARAGLHVEGEERVPRLFGDVLAGEPVDGDAGGDRLAALALDRLAMARIEAGEEIVEGREILVVPVKLLVGALQEAVLGQKFRLAFTRESHMRRRRLAEAAQRHQPAGERRADLLAIDVVADQEARAGCRRERHRALQLRIIAPARALIGVGPAAVEHVFALRMRLEITGHDAGDLASDFRQQMPRSPAGAGDGRARVLGRREKGVRHKGVVIGF